MEESLLSELSYFLFDYSKKRKLNIPENKIKRFVREVCGILIPLTLPIGNEYLLGNFKIKGMYSLWITLLDDSIDRGKDIKNDISENITILSQFAMNNHVSPRGTCGYILNDILTSFVEANRNAKKGLIMDMTTSDLLGDLCGFFYEVVTRDAQEVVTKTEYMEHSKNTIDFLFCLDCDLCFLGDIGVNEIGLLREAHQYFGMAFRLLNDLATFNKEYYVERTPNIVTFSLNKERDENNTELIEEVRKNAFKELRSDIEGYKKKIKETISKIEFFDTQTYYNNISRILKEYPLDLETSRNDISHHMFSL